MIYTITSGIKVNGRPTKVGVLTVNVAFEDTAYTFTSEDFISNTVPVFEDPENDELSYIQISNIDSNAELNFNGQNVEAGQIVRKTELEMGLLTFEPGSTPDENGYTFSFDYDAADNGSESLSGLGTGRVNVIVSAKINNPPDSVGDSNMIVPRGGKIVFTKANFTTETTPQYSDPEGDDVYSLKVLTLPDDGDLFHNGVAVVVNQEILFTEIELGYFTYKPNQSLNISANTEFTFALSDAGSKTFTT